MSTYSPHHLISTKNIPTSLVDLRTELALPEHKAIFDRANEGRSFEEVLGNIATELNIVVDGYYGVDAICAMLYKQLKAKRTTPSIRILT